MTAFTEQDLQQNYSPALMGLDPTYKPPKPPKPEFDPDNDARDLSDPLKLRQSILSSVQDAVTSKFPIENERYQMRLSNVGYGKAPDPRISEQKQAIMARKSLFKPLKGTWELVDKSSGQVVDSKRATVANVPFMTQRGTFIYNGNEYGISNQIRLRDGVYARRKGDGTVESHFNLMSGTGRAFRLGMDPKTGGFHVNIGQAKMPAYPMFRALGVPDKELREAWGEEVYNANMRNNDASVASKLYQRFSGEKLDVGEASEKLKEYTAKMRMSAAIARRSLGKYSDIDEDEEGNTSVSPSMLVATTRKLLALSRGEDDEDDRDALPNQRIMGPEDLFAERITKDSEGRLREMLWKATNKGKLPSSVGQPISKQLEAVLLNSGLAAPLEEINPLESLDYMNRVTRMGTGGLSSVDVIPEESRGVQPSYAGFIDPFRTTECYTAEMEVLTENEWVPWPILWAKWDEYGTIGTKIAVWTMDGLRYEEPVQLVRYHHKGQVFCSSAPNAQYRVTPDHRMYVVGMEGNTFYDTIKDTYGFDFLVLRSTGMITAVRADEQYKEMYDGFVYCATTPAGNLIVRRGETPGFVCGNSAKVGVDVRFASGIRKGKDGRVYRNMTDARTGKPKWVSQDDVADSVVAFPGELDKNEPYVRAVSGGKIDFFPRDDVSYQIRAAEDMHDVGVNLVPMVGATQGNRLLVAGKMQNQAMSLTNREAPRVQTKRSAGGTFEEWVGDRMGTSRADARGKVLSVTDDAVTVIGDDGQKREYELYNNFPLNRKSYFSSEPLVAPGDVVEPGQLVAKSNYTDGSGAVSLGTHLRTAYLPYKGLGYEDGYVLSESAAKKMSHESMYQSAFEKEDGDRGLDTFMINFPKKFTSDQLKMVSKDGVVKAGTQVRKGDPLVLAVGTPPKRAEGHQLTSLHRSLSTAKTDKSVTWEHDFDGVVTDSFVGDDGGVKVAVKATVPLQEGDKIAGHWGDKGVGRIVADALMPHDKDGNPYELIQSPLTVPTRKNPAQLYALKLAQLARIRGEPYILDKYQDGSLNDYVRSELKKYGMNEDGTEEVYDPETGKMNKTLTGDKYVMALHHTAEAKGGARSAGGLGSDASYTAEGLPSRGGDSGAKSMANLALNGLISHNAYENINDMKNYRAHRNDDFWRSFMLGYAPPSPQVSDVYKKFQGHLRGAGINFKKKGDYTHLTAMMDKDVDELAGDNVISKAQSLDESLDPIPGGLFDRATLGGVGGNNWGKIELPEPMPSPVMEDGIKLLLGLTGKKFDSILSGEEQLGGKSGGTAIRDALGRINLDDSIAQARKDIASDKKTGRDKAMKRLRLLTKAKEFDIHPKNWVISKIPVIPPAMRPISRMKSGTTLISDANSLYADLMNNSDAYKEAKERLGDEGVSMERKAVYDSLKAAVGLGDPVHPKLQEKGTAGLLRHVFGKSSPKFGMYQRRVVGMNLDMSARGVVVPDPQLTMDEIGLPENQAWTLYGKFAMRDMIRNGLDATKAREEVENRTDRAKDILLKAMDERPLTYTRAPAMSRYSIMGAKPRMVAGNAIHISPLVTGPMTMDFDGDTASIHVPVGKKAIDEIREKLLPSKHLKNVRDFDVHYTPSQEFLLGLYQATRKSDNKSKAPKYFATEDDVKKAYRRGEIKLTDEVVVGGRD